MGLDLIARAQATRAQSNATQALQRVASVDLFESLPLRTVDAAITAVSTSGLNTPTRTHLYYGADSVASAALAAAHPLFCKASANGRYFRLMPDADGLLSAAASGAVPTLAQDDTVNHRTALAALLAYAEAIDARGIQFGSGHYSIWAPLRTATNDNTNADTTGIPFVINKRMEFCAGPAGTQFNRRKNDGSDPAIFAGTQTLANFWTGSANVAATVYWRGGMFFLKGTVSAPTNYADRSAFALRGKWRIWGGLVKSPTPGGGSWATTYALGADGSGWDIRDKGVFAEADRFSGDITYDGDITIGGFRGELHFQAGRSCGSVYQYGKLRMHDTDGDGFNPAPWMHATDATGTLRMDHLEIVNAYNALEGAAGWRSHIKRLDIFDCNSAQGLWAGTFQNIAPPVVMKPTFTINSLHVERSGTFYAMNGNRIDKAVLVDTTLAMGSATNGCTNILVGNLTVLADTANITQGAYFNGQGTQGNAYNRIRHLHCDRTANAIAGGFKVNQAVDGSGSLGDGCWVERITGFCSQPPKMSYAGVTGYWVGYREMYQDAYSGGGAATQNIETTPALTYYYGPRVLCTTTTNSGVFPVTLPDMTGKLPKGSRYEIANGQTVAVMSVLTTFTRLARRTLIRPGSSAMFEWDGAKWMLITPEQFLLGNSASVALLTGGLAIPANGVSDESTFAVVGARAGMVVIVAPTTTVSADAIFVGRVTANDTVGIRAKNANTATALTIGATIYSAELRYLS